jgi:hypothetical protein
MVVIMKNPPAFPTTKPLDSWGDPNQGMTLRDYFAAKAMQGMFVTAIDWIPTGKKADEESLKIYKDLAFDAYAMADAMLKAREQ